MRKAPINALIIRLKECFDNLNVSISDTELEGLAILVHDTMNGQMRKFHNIAHIFTVAEPFTEPLQVLACLFHDMVYYQVDNGFHPHTKKIAKNYIQVIDSQVVIMPKLSDLPTWWFILLDIFGFKVGDKPSIYGGLNEFLSAVVALHGLSPYLTVEQLIKIACCIEATIPFRGIDEHGDSNFEITERRLTQIALSYNLDISKEYIDEIIHASVAVSNTDVGNFAFSNTADFLDNTWLLIYEGNTNLKNAENFSYSTTGYRESLMKTEAFFKNLKPRNIFHQYKDVPTHIECARLTHQAQRNIAIAREYLAAKLCSATLFEALALETGGDVPLALLIGGIRSDRAEEDMEHAEDYLPALNSHEKMPGNPKVLEILTVGRNEDGGFDMRRSPLTAYLYEMIGAQGIITMLNKAKELFAKQITPQQFLEACNPIVVSRIASACAKLAITRKKALEKFVMSEEDENAYKKSVRLGLVA